MQEDEVAGRRLSGRLGPRRVPGLGDVVAGLSAALVLIPQALAYGALAGVPVQSGLYAAALAPLAAAFFASSPYLGTGPTAITSLLTLGALAAVVAPGTQEYVELAALLALVVGIMRVGLGLVRAGFLAYVLSQPILTGFTTGAALVIVASQIPSVVGATSTATNPFVSAFDVLRSPQEWRLHSIVLAAVVALAMVAGRRIHRLFPGVLLALVLAVLLSAVTNYGGAVVGNVDAGFPPLPRGIPWASLPGLLVPAGVIAIVGFAEPASIARHYATLQRRRWNPNRELVSQGVANLASGFGGGFPVGGSFSRSALLHDAGARTRLAGGLSGLVVLALLPATEVLAQLPESALGAVIIVSVVELLHVRPFRDLRRYARLQFAVSLLTLVMTVALAPHVERALIAGVGLAVAAHLWRELRLTIPAWVSDGTLHLAPKGVLYFASAPGLEVAFARALEQHPDADRLMVHLDGLGRIDLTGALVLRDFLADARAAGFAAEVADVPAPARKVVARVITGSEPYPEIRH
jgi:SulP family sulfate permease